MNGLDRVEQLLSDKSAVPWEHPSSDLRGRVLAATLDTRSKASGHLRLRGRVAATAAAALIAAGWIGVYFMSPQPQSPSPAPISFDPSPLLDRLAQEVTASMETSFTSEARHFLDHADQVTRNVVAQLPFTGSR